MGAAERRGTRAGARFKFERHQRESLATRALVRTALSRYRPIPPEAWQFTENAHGKPAIGAGVRAAVQLVELLGAGGLPGGRGGGSGRGRGAAGASGADFEAGAGGVFRSRSRLNWRVCADAEKLDRALSLWTLKESYIKARGMGLALPLDKFSFVFGGAEGIRLEMDASLGDEPERWRFCLLDHAGHRIAAMVEREVAGALEVWETRPVLGEPVRVSGGGAEWFPRG